MLGSSDMDTDRLELQARDTFWLSVHLYHEVSSGVICVENMIGCGELVMFTRHSDGTFRWHLGKGEP